MLRSLMQTADSLPRASSTCTSTAGAGADFMDGTPEAVITACTAHLRHGTTTIFPTTTTGSSQQIMDMIHACAVATQQSSTQPAKAARIAGVHLYGPYFAEDKVGCHAVGWSPKSDCQQNFSSTSIPGWCVSRPVRQNFPERDAFYNMACRAQLPHYLRAFEFHMERDADRV